MKPNTKEDTNEVEIEDMRLQPWPKVMRRGKEIRMSFRILPPFRLFLLYEFVFGPLCTLWKLAAVGYGVAYALQRFEVYDALGQLPFPHYAIPITLLIIAVFWMAERMRAYPLSRLFLGRTVGIEINEREVVVKAGLSRKNFPQQHRIGFAQHPIGGARTNIYQNSSFLCVIIGDIKRVPLVEMFHSVYVEDAVSNANAAMHIFAEMETAPHARPDMIEDTGMMM